MADSPNIRLTYQGFTFYCRKEGPWEDGVTPLLIIGGAFQNMDSWTKLTKQFVACGKSLLLVDLPGVGLADTLPGEYGLMFLSYSIEKMLDDLGIPSVIMGSFSYGSPIGYRFAQMFHERVERMILGGIMQEIPEYVKPAVLRSIRLSKENNSEEFISVVLGDSTFSQGMGLLCTDPNKTIRNGKLARRVLTTQLKSMGEDDRKKYEVNTMRVVSGELLKFPVPPRCPTLVFTGEHDCFTRPEYCLTIAEHIPNSVFTTIRDADHLFNLEQPDVTFQLFHNFAYDLPLSPIPDLNPIQYLGES